MASSREIKSKFKEAQRKEREERNLTRKTREYFKLLIGFTVTASIILVVLAYIGNFILLWNNKMPMTQEIIQLCVIFGGVVASSSTASYAILNSIRATSLNKTHRCQIDKLGVTTSVIPPTSQEDINNIINVESGR